MTINTTNLVMRWDITCKLRAGNLRLRTSKYTYDEAVAVFNELNGLVATATLWAVNPHGKRTVYWRIRRKVRRK